MRSIWVKDLLPPPVLAERQARIARGLLAANVDRAEIRALPWYDERLEVHVPFPGDVSTDPVHAASGVSTLSTDVSTGDGMDTVPDPTDVRHGGDVVTNRKAYKAQKERERRARLRGLGGE